MAKKNINDDVFKIISFIRRQADDIAVAGGHPNNILRYKELLDIASRIENGDYKNEESSDAL